MEKKLFPFSQLGSHPYSAAAKHRQDIEGLNLEINLSSLAIFPVAVGGKQINSILEIPVEDVPALIRTLIQTYNEFETDNAGHPKLELFPDTPQTVLSLRIQYAGEDSQFNEERLFPHTAEGIQNAVRTAETINAPQEGEDEPDIWAEKVELWRWTQQPGHYYEPEPVQSWDTPKPGPQPEHQKTDGSQPNFRVGAFFWTRTGNVARIDHPINNAGHYVWTGVVINADKSEVYESWNRHGRSIDLSVDDENDLMAEIE